MLDLQILNRERIIHLTEVSATDFPASNRYKYKGRVQFASHEGEIGLQKDLFSRMQPSGLVELKNKGDCTIALIRCYRKGDISQF